MKPNGFNSCAILFIFSKKVGNNFEINLPSLSAIIKYSIIIVIFSPWFYLLIKFYVKIFLENGLSAPFGRGDCICPNQEKSY